MAYMPMLDGEVVVMFRNQTWGRIKAVITAEGNYRDLDQQPEEKPPCFLFEIKILTSTVYFYEKKR